MATPISKDRIVKEIMQCGRYCHYFVNNYCKISEPMQGLIPFNTFPFQDQVLKDFQDYRFNIIKKARQLGMSTLTAAYVAWLILFHREKTILVIATKQSTAINFLKKVKTIIANIPPWLLLSKIKIDNRTSLELENGSTIIAESTSGSAARSFSASLLVIDEAAHVEDLEELWAGMYPTLSTGGSATLISCVTKDTFIFTDKGLEQISAYIEPNIMGGYKKTIPYHVFGKNKLREGYLFVNSGLSKTRKIITVNSKLECAVNHKLWAYSNKDKTFTWKKVAELSVGDFISIEYGHNIWGNNDLTTDFIPTPTKRKNNAFNCNKITTDVAYFLGLYLSEGYIRKVYNKNKKCIGGTVQITCGDDLSLPMSKLGIPVRRNKIGIQYILCSKQLIEFFDYLGFDITLKAPKKYIPDKLLQMSRENIIALLQGIFDGDGYSRIDRGQVGIGLSSKRMIKQIRMLLLNLGILTEYDEAISRPTEKVKVFSNSYRLNLNSSESRKFYDLVGFRIPRKQYKKVTLENQDLNRADTKDTVPNSLQLMKEITNLAKIKPVTLRKEYGVNVNGVLNKKKKYKTEHISRQNCLKIYNICKDSLTKEKRDYIEQFLSTNLKWVAITSIEENYNEVFDFSLPNNEEDFWAHSVVYNGILGHQSPNGVGNFFYQTYIDAESGQNDFHAISLPWDVHPDRNQEWFEKETRNMSKRQIAQELLVTFLSSGDNVIDAQDIEKIEKSIKEPIRKTGHDRNIWIWEEYNPKHQYAICCDISRGDSQDNSTAQVFDITEKMTQVAEYQGKIPTDVFGRLLYGLGKEYGFCLLAVENNGVGNGTVNELSRLQYPNLYYAKKGSYEYVEQYIAETSSTSNIMTGYTMTNKNRPLIIAKFEEFIRTGVVELRSSRLYHEITTFIWHNGRPEATRSTNDDLVVAAAVACWIRDTALVVNSRELAYKKSLLGAIYTTSRGFDLSMEGLQRMTSPSGRVLPEDERAKRQQFAWFYKG